MAVDTRKLVGRKVVAAREEERIIGPWKDSSSDVLVLELDDGSVVELAPVSAVGGDFACTITDGDPDEYVG